MRFTCGPNTSADMCECVFVYFRLEEEKAKAVAEAQAKAQQQIQAQVQKVMEKEQPTIQQSIKDAIMQQRKNIQDGQLAMQYYVRHIKIDAHAQFAKQVQTHLVP